ncbi:ANR family transcriptional regulator [Pantoea piersonii]|uniref:ANR family transcriptional regulator n=1 Tax=Pantoea piersonii TaxID=2364647 RepID=UPI0022F178C1|nr:ANR family transcriptional regulator [Pantoea piersonii]WBV22583.1 ANR family transcriptional regulator [Pantoea piersonii]
MNQTSSDTRRSLYMRVAAEAAMAEQTGNWQRAATLWTEAAGYARRPVNMAWAEYRAGFCSALHARSMATTEE